MSATVRNVGSGTLAATTLRYYYYRSSSLDWVMLGTDSVGSLSPSSSSPESIRLTIPSRAGTYYFFNVCVASVAGERNKDNCSGNLSVSAHKFLKDFERGSVQSRFLKKQKTKRSERRSADVCGVR